MNVKMMMPAVALLSGVAVFGVGYGLSAVNNRTNQDHNYGSDVVAVVPADREDTYTVDYQQGEILFSSQDGSWLSVRDSWCEKSEDSCHVTYHHGYWAVKRVAGN